MVDRAAELAVVAVAIWSSGGARNVAEWLRGDDLADPTLGAVLDAALVLDRPARSWASMVAWLTGSPYDRVIAGTVAELAGVDVEVVDRVAAAPRPVARDDSGAVAGRVLAGAVRRELVATGSGCAIDAGGLDCAARGEPCPGRWCPATVDAYRRVHREGEALRARAAERLATTARRLGREVGRGDATRAEADRQLARLDLAVRPGSSEPVPWLARREVLAIVAEHWRAGVAEGRTDADR